MKSCIRYDESYFGLWTTYPGQLLEHQIHVLEVALDHNRDARVVQFLALQVLQDFDQSWMMNRVCET